VGLPIGGPFFFGIGVPFFGPGFLRTFGIAAFATLAENAAYRASVAAFGSMQWIIDRAFHVVSKPMRYLDSKVLATIVLSTPPIKAHPASAGYAARCFCRWLGKVPSLGSQSL
jgi:hypothetical protein